jgi:hypothetical protein
MEVVDNFEPLVDDYFESYGNYGLNRWTLKDKYRQEFYGNVFEHGDIIYFDSKVSQVSMKQLDAYLGTIGCTRTLDKSIATKIYNNHYKPAPDLSLGAIYTEKPKYVPSIIFERHKMVMYYDITSKVKTYIDSLRPKITFDFEAYKNFWNLMKSGKSDDTRLAAVGIMTTDWTGNEFLLHVLTHYFIGTIRSGNLSTIPKFSNWANSQGIPWKQHEPAAWSFLQVFKKYDVTEEQTTLIKKLLNLK